MLRRNISSGLIITQLLRNFVIPCPFCKPHLGTGKAKPPGIFTISNREPNSLAPATLLLPRVTRQRYSLTVEHRSRQVAQSVILCRLACACAALRRSCFAALRRLRLLRCSAVVALALRLLFCFRLAERLAVERLALRLFPFRCFRSVQRLHIYRPKKSKNSQKFFIF